eukprot:6101901-Pyramimonas_sp.AAC.1
MDRRFPCSAIEFLSATMRGKLREGLSLPDKELKWSTAGVDWRLSASQVVCNWARMRCKPVPNRAEIGSA